MKKNVSPWWIAIAVILLIGVVYLIAQRTGLLGGSQHATESTLEELAKQKPPVDVPPAAPGGVEPGSGMVGPTLMGGGDR